MKSRHILYLALACLVALLAGLFTALMWSDNGPEFTHDEPRQLPWRLRDYRQATTQYEILADGRIKIEIQHLPLRGVSPAMVAWFYQQLPISTVELAGRTYPLYHMFHPTEHGKIWVTEAATNGDPGMGVGALVGRQEWFGPYNSKGAARVLEFSDAGMTFMPEIGGLSFGKISHRFERTSDGTRYHLTAILGSDLAMLGPVINFYIRNKIFTPPMLEQWLRHQVEEVGSLQFFLPQIYAQDGPTNHYQIDTLNDPGAKR